MDILIFGTGALSVGIESEIAPQHTILAFLDNDPKKVGKPRNGIPVLNPEDGIKLPFDHIFTASSFHEEMRSQLTTLGVPENQITQARTSPEWFNDNTIDFTSYAIAPDTESLITHKHRFTLGPKALNEQPMHITESTHNAIIDRLWDSLQQALNDADSAAPAYRTGKNWKAFLDATRPNFTTALRTNDKTSFAAMLRSFCRNELSSGILGGKEAFDDFSVLDLKAGMHENFKIWSYSIGSAPVQELASPSVGNPYGYLIDGHIVHPNTFLNHSRACMVEKLLSRTPAPVIAEIGGGFGGLAYYIKRKLPSSHYINFDLPENLLISSYYLACSFPEKKIYTYRGSEDLARVIATNEIILLPNFLLPKLADTSIDMFINTISLSEMNFSTIKEYINQIDRTCKKYFYHENLIFNSAGYTYFPVDTFPAMRNFTEISRAPSRWPFFSHASRQHCHSEQLLINNQLLQT